jgi:hypothetical protein
VNYLRLKYSTIFTITMLFFSFIGGSQNTQAVDIMDTIITSGSNATGSSGTVAYSIGQVFYTYFGAESIYNVAQGVQHTREDEMLDRPDIDKPATEIFIFPNPTTDFVNIRMNGLELESGQRSYKLYDIQGRIIKQYTINEMETEVSLNTLNSSIYLLVVYDDNKILKTFKIVKN